MHPISHFSLGRPVVGDSFFGRHAELARIQHSLHSGSAVNFYSLRRMGKSSILRQIHYLSTHETNWEQYQPIFIDAYLWESENGLASGIIDSLGIEKKSTSPDHAWKEIRKHAKNITDKPILLLDESDVWIKQNNPRDFGALRALQQEGIINIVASTLHGSIFDHLKQSTSVGSPFFNIFDSFRLPAFHPKEAEELLIVLCDRGGVKLNADVAQELARYVGYYPNLVQEIGNRAFLHLLENKTVSPKKVASEWRHRSAYQWLPLIIGAFQEEFEGTVAHLVGLKPEEYLSNSLEAYGILLRDDAGKLEIAPYVQDTLIEGGAIQAEKTLERLQYLANIEAQKKQDDAMNNPNVATFQHHSIHIEKGEVIMGDKFVAGNNIGGIQNIGKFNHVVSNLNASGKNELANALVELKEAIIASQHLANEKKEEHIEVLNTIGNEASKPKPNKTLMQILGEGLLTTLKAIPDVVKAVIALEPLLTQITK